MTDAPAPVRVAMVSVDKDLIDTAGLDRGLILEGVFDADPAADAAGLPVIGTDAAWPAIAAARPALRLLMAVDPPALRRRLLIHYGAERCVTFVAADAYIAPSARVGTGCIVQRAVTILTDVVVGANCKLNVGATLHHDSRVGDGCTLAPGCRLLGRVVVEERVYVGAGAVVLPNLRIGRDAVVGAGAVVTRDVPPGTTVVGVPARPIGG